MAAALADQIRNGQIRDWARDNGWAELSDRGRIPDAIVSAFDAAHGAGDDDDDGAGPDFGAAAAAMGLELGTSPLDGDDDTADLDAAGGGSEPPPQRPPAAPDQPEAGDRALPQPVSLDDVRDRLGAAKAQPGWAKPPGDAKRKPRTRTRQPKPPAPADDRIQVTPQLLEDMQGKLLMLLLGPARAWAIADPECGGAAVDYGPDIVAAWLPVITRSQAVVRLLTTDAVYFQLVAAVTATWPLIETIRDHHFSEAARERRELERRNAQHAATQAAQDDYMYPTMPAPVTVQGHVPEYRPAQARM